MNNRKFWNNYNKQIKSQLLELIKDKKSDNIEFVLCDLHIHSNHSSDGKQSILDIINESIKNKLEIVAITDHDSVSVFDDLYSLIKRNKLPKNAPIIIPGIEHTVSFKDYQTMCHILKYFINPKSKKINNDIRKLNKSYYNRAKIQFSRINESEFYNELFEKHQIQVSYKEFIHYLKSKNIIPDYAPLIDYLADKFNEKNVKTEDIYKLVREYNNKDNCIERKRIKDARFLYLDNKYQGIDVQDNRRFMLSILGVRGVDDAYFPNYPVSGSLSVDEYGQVSIFDLNSEGVTVFAHPDHTKLHLINKIKDCAGGFYGIELNFKSKQEFFDELIEFAKQEDLSITKGSDRHKVEEPVYENIEFYKLPVSTIEALAKKG